MLVWYDFNGYVRIVKCTKVHLLERFSIKRSDNLGVGEKIIMVKKVDRIGKTRWQDGK